ncbi:MAG: transporter substrate-binding domain-containing protein, partial [Pontibacterium sp.]
MKYMQYAVMAVCGFLVSLPLQADHEVLDVVYSDQWPPYSYSNEQGQPDGILVHLVDRLLGQQLKIPLKHHILPWKRAQKLVEQGHFDAMMAVPTPDRLLYAERTQSVLYQFKVQAFVSKRSPRAETILQAENP